MLFSYSWLQSYVKRKLPRPKELAELLTMHSFEVKSIEKRAKDWILDIDILPNRAGDCLSHIGVARECCALTGSKFQIPDSKVKEDKTLKVKNFVEIEVKDKKDCPRYTARVIIGVKVGPSPKWIKEKLEACGQRSINNVVDITNYVMLETGQPLHAFDFDKIEANKRGFPQKKIIVRRAKDKEKIITLDNEEYGLNEDVLVIADEKEPLAIAGIKGGKKAEIDSRTKNIILESANFDPQLIRKASRKINLKTDSSWHFENGLDPNLAETAINRAAFLISKIAKGKVAQGLVDFYPKKVLSKKIRLDLEYLKSLLGIDISRKEAVKILESLGLKVKDYKLRFLNVEVPTFRLDISIQEDLIEEVARIYGFQKLVSRFPQAVLVPPKRNLEIFWEKIIKDNLKEAGFFENYNYSFINEKTAKIFRYNLNDLIEIKNPVSIEYKYLRPSLIPNLLKNVGYNFRYFNKIKIFEVGKVFNQLADNSKQIAEKKMLTGVIAEKGGEDGFYQLKGVVDLLLQKLGISNIWYDQYQPTPEESDLDIWNPKRCAEIKIGQEEIGFLGEISFKILRDLDIEGELVVFDFDFEKLVRISSEEYEYRPLSKFPSAVRDLAILVPIKVKVIEVLNKINLIGGKLVRDVDLFDIYEGEELPEGKKNLAFHIIYQAEDRTLSSEEIEEIHQKIIKNLEKEQDWEIRK